MKKKSMMLSGMMVVTMLVAGFSWAQDEGLIAESTETTLVPPPPVEPSVIIDDSELIARAFLGHEINRYVGWFNFQRTPIVGKPYWVSGNFEMKPDGWVTSLSIDGVVIIAPGDEPIGGLPANRDGSAGNYNLGLNGIDTYEQSAVNGNFYTELLLPGDPIAVTLHPSYEERFVPFAVPIGENPENFRIRVSDNNGVWTYDLGRGGFGVWLDPSARYTYEIFNYVTGEIYERGDIENPGSTGDNIVSTNYGGVSGMLMDWSQSWDNLQQAMFDHSVERDDWQIPAKVIMTRAYEGSMSIQANYLPSDGRIEVLAWQEEGEMPLIATADAVYQDGGGWGKAGDGGFYWANLQTPVGYDKLVVTFTGTIEPGQTFDIYLSRGGGRG